MQTISPLIFRLCYRSRRLPNSQFHVLPLFPLPRICKDITLPSASRISFLGKANSAKVHQSQLRTEISRVIIRLFFCQQVRHHVSVRQLRKQRFGGCSGVLGGLLQQRAESAHLRLLQPGFPGRLQEDPRKLLRGDRAGSRSAPSPSQAGSGAQ